MKCEANVRILGAEKVWEFFGRFLVGLVPTTIKSFMDRQGLKLICGWGNEPNMDGVGNYLALWVKIVNPTSSSFYFDRIVTIEKEGGEFFPSVIGVKAGDEILPRRNLVALIPCGHVTSSKLVELHVYDCTDRRFSIKGRRFRKLISELSAERTRLESLHFSVHPSAE